MRVLWVSIVIVAVDQLSKVAVLRTMHRGESIPLVGDWFKFTFTENPGIAFGLEIFPRQATAVFSIFVTVVVLWYLFSVRSGYWPYLTSLALILGGAIGNIIDRAFYGVILGYGDFFEGKVVDFVHVDAWRGTLPEVLPWIGGARTALFPIWNVADMAIVVGVVGILVFQRRFHQRAFEEPARERQRLRELEREHEAAAASTSTTSSSPGGGLTNDDTPGGASFAPSKDTATGAATTGVDGRSAQKRGDARADGSDERSPSAPEETDLDEGGSEGKDASARP